MADRRPLAKLDLPMLLSATSLTLLGCLFIQSATAGLEGISTFTMRQLVAAVLGLVALVGVSRMPGRWLRLAAPAIYTFSIVLLLLVLIAGVGVAAKGSQRWLMLGPLSFQPSELAKFGVTVGLAGFLSTRKPSGWTLLGGLSICGLPCLLVVLQPDLGTSISIAAIAFTVLFVWGANRIALTGLAVGALAVLPYILKDYQQTRLTVFLNPDLDPLGAGYSLSQSKASIGSGGWYGKGLFQGEMTQYGFVPENWTDFIITVVGEELGFQGILGVLLLIAVLLFSIFRAALNSRTRFGFLVATGVGTSFGLHFVFNLGMSVGLGPVVGLPLPLLSFGGTALVANLAALGAVTCCCHEFRDELPGPGPKQGNQNII